MKILVIGAGGTGGAIGGFLAADGQDVTFIARGQHLKAMQQQGLRLDTQLRGTLLIASPKACIGADYAETPDVIFICVKDYSLQEASQLVARVATPTTLIIPILNVCSAGDRLRAENPTLHIIDGCIYIFAKIGAPGVIVQEGPVFRVVFGDVQGKITPDLLELAAMLEQSGIKALVSENIRRDCYQKLALVSPMAAVGCFYDADAQTIRETPSIFADYLALTEEISAVAAAMGLVFTQDMVETNRKNITNSIPTATTSLHRDVKKGGDSELDGLIFEPVRMGRKYQVPTPVYEKIARRFGFCE